MENFLDPAELDSNLKYAGFVAKFIYFGVYLLFH